MYKVSVAIVSDSKRILSYTRDYNCGQFKRIDSRFFLHLQ